MDRGPHPAPEAIPRIGPNAVTRVAEAMRDAAGEDAVLALFADAGLGHHLATPPERMVAEGDVTRLHAALRARLGEDGAARISAAAGRLTGDYLLAHRIPRPLQAVLRWLPPRLATRLLLGAVGRHAWTFAGSGRVRARPGRPARLAITGCALCRGARTATPACGYFAATLERLFQALVARDATVTETACAGQGATACIFEIRF